MPSQLELLKEQLKRSEARSGSDNPFVKGLKARIAKLEKPHAPNPVEMYSAGTRPAPMTQDGQALPEAPTRDQFKTQAEFEEALGGWRSRAGRIKGLKVGKKTEA